MATQLHELTTPAATVGVRLRSLRKERHLTQAELARQIGIQQSDLSRMEKGEYRVSLDNLFKILAVFDVSFEDFFAEPEDEPRRALSREDMQILQLVKQLSEDGRREAMEFLEFKVRREQQDRRAIAVRRRDRETGS